MRRLPVRTGPMRRNAELPRAAALVGVLWTCVACADLSTSGHRTTNALATAEAGFEAARRGEQDRAIELYTRAIESSHLDRRALGTAYLNRGNAYLALDRHREAIADLDRAVRLDPHDVDALMSRGAAHGVGRAYARALRDYDRAASIRPDPRALYGRALAGRFLGQYDAALRDFSASITRRPDDLDALLQRGIVLAVLGRPFEAEADWRRVHDLANDAISRQGASAQTLNARCYVRTLLGEATEALPDCTESLRLRRSADTLDSRGLAYARIGRLAEAVADYDAALLLDARHPMALYGRGWARQRLGDHAGAARDLAAAREVYSTVDKEMVALGLR